MMMITIIFIIVSIIHTCNQVKIYGQYLILTKIYSQIQFSPTFALESERMCFFLRHSEFLCRKKKKTTNIHTYIHTYMLGHHVGDLMGEDPDCCCCCLQFMVKPYSVIMECIKGMNYVSCPVERERERERERSC